jgi:hypothetical protein
MKNKLPLIFLAGGAVVFILAFMMLRGRGGAGGDKEENVPDLPFSQRPYTQLVPTEDGHYLNMIVSNINVPNAKSMDYELYYGTADEITQGVPGKVNLEGKNSVERELLLGSESSGKFRYDQGVDDGTLTLRFRDSGGKLIGKVAGQWKYVNNTDTLESLDGKFTYKLDEESDAYFIIMPTFGLPGSASFEVDAGPYGVFSSTGDELSGKVTLAGNAYFWNGKSWDTVSGGTSDNIGVFVTSK